jgi:PhnB protein
VATHLNPYLSFRDDARDAMEFYQSVFGGELTLSTFGDFQAGDDPAEAAKIMHGQLESPGGLVLMGADTPAGMSRATESNVSVSVSGEDLEELQGYWDRLADGGTVLQPFAQAPWGATFGMLADRFGVTWLINASPES